MVALSSEHQSCENIASYDTTKKLYYVLTPHDVAKSLETEEQIYDTPFNFQEGYGPAYSNPSDDEAKLLLDFERKKIQKLYHEDIK